MFKMKIYHCNIHMRAHKVRALYLIGSNSKTWLNCDICGHNFSPVSYGLNNIPTYVCIVCMSIRITKSERSLTHYVVISKNKYVIIIT